MLESMFTIDCAYTILQICLDGCKLPFLGFSSERSLLPPDGFFQLFIEDSGVARSYPKKGFQFIVK